MKDTPWFKFTASNWLSGSVQLLSDSEKGTYIDLISMIWKDGGRLEFNKVLARKLRIDYATACDRIKSYCDLGIMACENDILSIKFLDNQLESIESISKKNAENARKRWKKDNGKCDRMPIREDKRDKKDKIDKKEGISSEPAKPAHSSNLDFNYQTGKFNIDIPYSWIEVFTLAYPAVDINLEISKAKAWLFANPKKRKVDHKAYLNNWLARCQKQGGNISSNKPKKDIRNHNIYD